jgi:hypothetical protein
MGLRQTEFHWSLEMVKPAPRSPVRSGSGTAHAPWQRLTGSIVALVAFSPGAASSVAGTSGCRRYIDNGSLAQSGSTMLFTMMHSDVIRIQLYVPQDEAFKQPILQVDIEIGHSGQHPRCLPSVEFAPSGYEAEPAIELAHGGSRQSLAERFASLLFSAFVSDQQVSRGLKAVFKLLASGDCHPVWAEIGRNPAVLRPRCGVVQGSCRSRVALKGCAPMPWGSIAPTEASHGPLSILL